MRTCKKCGEVKDLDQFHKVSKGRTRSHNCKKCHNKTTTQWKRDNPHTKLGYHIKRYGINLVQYDKMLSEQAGLCAICGKTNGNKRLAVDHDHKTGQVRGLLCTTCNHMLGQADDNIIILEKGIKYLQKERLNDCS